MDHNLVDQVDTLIRENRALRVAHQTIEDNYRDLKSRYNELANEIENIRTKSARQVREANTERDRAVIEANEVKGLLQQAAETIMQAFRASTGDNTPENIPERITPHLIDPRLPPPDLGTSDPVLADLIRRLPLTH